VDGCQALVEATGEVPSAVEQCPWERRALAALEVEGVEAVDQTDTEVVTKSCLKVQEGCWPMVIEAPS